MNRTAKLVQLRGWDILVFGKKGNRYYDGYRQALGTKKVEYIKVEAEDDFERTNFDVQIKAIIDDQEQQFLEANIASALTQKEITLADAIDVRKLAEIDVDYASYMLSARIQRRQKEAIQQTTLNNEQNTQAAEAAALAKGEQDRQTELFKHQLKMQQLEAEQKGSKELEVLKAVNEIKKTVAAGVIAEPTSGWKDIPQFVFDGIGIVDQTQTQLMVQDFQQQQQEEAEQQQQMMAQQQQEQAAAQQEQQQGVPVAAEAPDQPEEQPAMQ